MDHRWRHPHGLRPTLRQVMILVVLAALISAAASPLLRGSPGRTEWLLAGLLVAASPILLATLLLAFDRRTPAKSWLVALVASLARPAFVAWLDAVAVTLGWLERGPAALVPLALANVGAILWLARMRRRLPTRCPACGLRSLLPIGRLRWCASCGLKLAAQASEGANRSPMGGSLPPVPPA